MSKLEELIKEFCPNGVEYKRIGDIGRVAMCKRIMKSDTASEGDVPFYKIGTFGKKADAYINRDKYEEYRAKYSYPKKGDILISAAGQLERRSSLMENLHIFRILILYGWNMMKA